jgi:hypothetical protein
MFTFCLMNYDSYGKKNSKKTRDITWIIKDVFENWNTFLLSWYYSLFLTWISFFIYIIV